ncbi:MAG: substrate-binding domain-containing protein [Bacteroidia bacterium]|jgi:ribose transport system substrate-binding protein|nr:substrate-binding domain-containing protein [Bacteroidia bacterium]
MKKILCLLLVVTLVTGALFAAGAKEEKAPTLGFAVSTLANDFFVTMKEGGDAQAKVEGYNLITLDAQDSPELQTNQIEDLLNRKVDLLILNPVDSDAVGTSVEAANRAGIPVITVTRAASFGKVEQHLDIDNREAGQLVAEQMIKDLNGRGKVAMLEGIPGASSTNDRKGGFVDTIKGTNIDVVVSLTANYNREQGATVMEDILQGYPNLDAVYAHNDEMALGAVRAIDAAGKTGKIKVYGVDAVDDALKAVENGEMAATVQQQPALQMKMAVQNSVKFLKGEKIESLINIPLKLITKDTL